MFPVADVIPSRSMPYVTIALIALNTAAFAYELTLTNVELRRLMLAWGVVPADFAWPTLVTSQFLHSGWIHFLVNMLYLWIFGDNVEDRLGRAGYLGFYLACGGAAAAGQLAIDPDSTLPLVGASGSIAGVMGAYLVLFPRSRVLTAVFIVFFLDLVEVPAIFFLGLWFIAQLLSGVGAIGTAAAGGGVAFGAHLSGFAAGALVGLACRARRLHRHSWDASS